MDTKAKEMVKGWLEMHLGDAEAVARYIANTLRVCGIKEARRMVAEAVS